MRQPLSYPLGARVSEEVRVKFLQKSAKYGGASAVIRELIHAFVENRLTVKPAKPPKELFK